MNFCPFVAVALVCAPLVGVFGKPPLPSKADVRPSPSPSAVADGGSASLLRWLLLLSGGPEAAAVSWPELVLTAGGKQISPLVPANAPDAALLAKLGASLDALLPKLNRPDGPLRTQPPLTSVEIAARIADELRAALPAADALGPVLKWNDNPTGRTCYLVVAPYSAGGREGALHTLTVRAADLAGQFTTEGACLAIGIEHNGRLGRDLAFLNWEAIDLARVSLRCAVTFETDASGLHAPGATLADGRRRRD